MTKHNTTRPEVQTRELLPRIVETGKEVRILCPFCEPPHPIAVGQDSACGTSLRVSAVQVIIPSRTVHRRNLICVKCHKSGGRMIKYFNGYVHLDECTPNTKLMTAPPEFSKLAAAVFKLPPLLRGPLERRLGQAKQVKEVDPSGKDTGNILGYFFYRPTGG